VTSGMKMGSIQASAAIMIAAQVTVMARLLMARTYGALPVSASAHGSVPHQPVG
jgi:hypothetical protein